MKVPKLRFPSFTDKWQVMNLGVIAEFSKGANISKYDIVEGGRTKAIRYGELYTVYSETIKEALSSTNLPLNSLVLSKQNDVIVPASGETHIDIATASCVLKEGIALSGDINIIRTNENGVFLTYYLNNKKKYDIARLAQGVSVIHLYSSNLKELSLNLPNIGEQEKIAEFLTTIDERIALIEEKAELLKKYKKGVMQKIFTQQIRFKDEDGNAYPEWGEKYIEDLFSEGQNRYSKGLPLLSVTLDRGVINRDEIDRKDNSSDVKTNYKRVNKGDIAYNSMRMWQGASGVSGYDGVVSPAYTVLKPRDGQVSKFFGYYFKLPRVVNLFERFSQGLTSDTWNLKYPQIAKIKLMIPAEAEQQKIADFLIAIDDKIKLEEINLEKAKEFKKSLLQRMFV